MTEAQIFDVPPDRKRTYGEVTTPQLLIDDLLDRIPDKAYSSNRKWLDVGSGYGYFADSVCKRLPKRALGQVHLSEANPEHVARLRERYAGNVHDGCFLAHTGSYDAIVGNPPYVVGGIKKVPTKTGITKQNDGRTAWTVFVLHALSLLNPGGYIAMIVPSLWLRNDRAQIHQALLSNRLVSARCYDAGQALKLFRGAAQTPVVSFVVQKAPPMGTAMLYSGWRDVYVPYPCSTTNPLPVACPSLVRKFVDARERWGGLTVSKSNEPKAGTLVGDGEHRNIRTVHLNGLVPYIVTEASEQPLAWAGIPKLVLAHKMYGLPYIDEIGNYGISRRDNYIITGRSVGDMRSLRSFMETRVVRCLFGCFRYRMRYLEREAFAHLFDCTAVETAPAEVTDEWLIDFLGLDCDEVEYVVRNSGRDYHRTREN
jgi:hypothetical protein